MRARRPRPDAATVTRRCVEEMAMKLVIANRNYSSWSLRAWLALEHTGAEFEEELILLGRPDTAGRILAVSPSGRVPVLVDGPVVVWDSLAISEHLAERFPDAGLWPTDAVARGRARSVCAEMHAGFQALRAGMPMNMRRLSSGVERTPELEADIRRVQAIWRDALDRWAGPFLFGAFSLADCFFAPVVSRFRTYGIELDGAVGEYAGRIEAWPAFRRWREAALAEPWTMPTYDL